MPDDLPKPDVLESGAGPPVLLVHSSVAAAKQWKRLTAELEGRYRVIAPNLFGYGGTPPWPGGRAQRLDDHAALVESALPDDAAPIRIVGHSFGAAVAMRLAARLGARAARLVLIEPNPFLLLREAGREAAFAEVLALRQAIKGHGGAGDWHRAAQRFADYWGGAGNWAAMSAERRAAFAAALKPNFHEWDAIMAEDTTLEAWRAALPGATLVMKARETALPIREIFALMRAACPEWRFSEVEDGGHMAPLTRPDLVNPIVTAFLDRN